MQDRILSNDSNVVAVPNETYTVPTDVTATTEPVVPTDVTATTEPVVATENLDDATIEANIRGNQVAGIASLSELDIPAMIAEYGADETLAGLKANVPDFDFNTLESHFVGLDGKLNSVGALDALSSQIDSYSEADVDTQVRDAQVANEYKDTSDFTKGMMSTWEGIKVLGSDLLNAVGLEEDEEHKKYVEDIQKFTSSLDKSVKDKEPFSSNTAGKAIAGLAGLVPAAIATLPALEASAVGATTALLGTAIDASITYGLFRAEGDEPLEAGAYTGLGVAGGALVGALGWGAYKVFKNSTEETTRALNTKLRSKYLSTDKAVDDFKDYYDNKWTDILEVQPDKIKKGLQPLQDETMALVKFIEKEQGQDLTSDVVAFSGKGKEALTKSEQTIKDAVRTVGGDTKVTKDEILNIATSYRDYKDTTDVMYTKLKPKLAGIHVTEDRLHGLNTSKYFPKKELDAIDKVAQSAINKTRESLSKTDLQSLVEGHQSLNALGSSMTRQEAKQFELTGLKNSVEKLIGDTLEKKGKSELKHSWDVARDRASNLIKVRKSSIGDVFKKVVPDNSKVGTINKDTGSVIKKKEATMTLEEGLTALEKLSTGKDGGGDDLFVALQNVVGKDKAETLELMTVNKALTDKTFDIGKFVDITSTKGFQSEKGKEFTSLVRKIYDTLPSNLTARGKFNDSINTSGKTTVGGVINNRVTNAIVAQMARSFRVFGKDVSESLVMKDDIRKLFQSPSVIKHIKSGVTTELKKDK